MGPDRSRCWRSGKGVIGSYREGGRFGNGSYRELRGAVLVSEEGAKVHESIQCSVFSIQSAPRAWRQDHRRAALAGAILTPVDVIEFRFNHGDRLSLASGEIFYVDWGLYIERKWPDFHPGDG